MDTLYIVMPAYNEEANIEMVVEQWYKVLDGKGTDSRLVVADSGSKDNTHKILLRLKEKYDKLEILENTMQQHGPKVIALYDYALKNGADYIFQTDSDGQTNPNEINNFWDLRKNYDAILGYRITRGDGKQRSMVQKVVCILLKIYFGINTPDANAPFRLMKSEVVAKHLYKMDKNYNIPNIMMTTFFEYYHQKVEYIPITFKPRQGGVNSINLKKIIKIGIQAIKDFKMFKKAMKTSVKKVSHSRAV